MKISACAAWGAFTLACALPALSANDRFYRESAASTNGFEPVDDAAYRKECGACHTAYLPGLLPSRSWQLHMTRLDKHFGETLSLAPDTQAHIEKYLAAHAADKSKFEGSILVMERIDPARTPYRFEQVPLLHGAHTTIRGVIDRRAKIKVKSLASCQACHLKAEEGSFGSDELFVPGLTPDRK